MPTTPHPAPDPGAVLRRALDAIDGLDGRAVADAEQRQPELAKPPGSLGVLEQAAVRLAGIQGVSPPRPLRRPAVAVFAADHGVHAQGVTPWPQEVTAAMVANFRAGGAAVNVLARHIGAAVLVVDMGVVADLDAGDDLLDHKIRHGTSDLSVTDAMTRSEAEAGVAAGIAVADGLVDRGHDCLLTGDMGIANTTASAALVGALTGAAPEDVTGRGTGVDDPTWQVKVDVVRRALARGAGGDGTEPRALDTLASVGGFEHAGLVGFLVGAAARRVPVVLDGIVAGAAALVAQALAPGCIDYCFAGHRSAEPGHRVALERLGLRPMVDLDLRLGEGTGAALAYPILAAAGATLREMATFDEAGVARKTGVTERSVDGSPDE
jgi:nicotinate-nucleotide--dimethylbenzimidazole phosphoribosyltransferase